MFNQQVQPQIPGITPYIPGKPISELQRELRLPRISKLASNENPLGASLKATVAIQSAIADISLYPDGSAFVLKKSLAKFLDFPESGIAVGNGSNELLELVARVFAGPGDEIIYAQYAFAVYAISAQVVGAVGVEVPAKNWGHDLSAMLSAITERTKIIYLANPNNPTGTLFEVKEWEAFINKVPSHVMVVLDEAYYEFVSTASGIAYANGQDYLKDHDNLLVSRTFSKAYGLASLRVGYMLGNAEVIGYINRIREPFNVNHFAQVAATAALKDQNFIQQVINNNQQGMQQIIDGIDLLGLEYIPSYGNFLCVAFHSGEIASKVNEGLLKQGVIVRPIANYGLKEHLRVSIGSPKENRHFLEALSCLSTLWKPA
jgi:histidinol-phosphate aminotransferase